MVRARLSRSPAQAATARVSQSVYSGLAPAASLWWLAVLGAALLSVGVGLLTPKPAFAQLRLENEDFALELSGRIQPGYLYRVDDPDDQRFFFGQNRIAFDIEAYGQFHVEMSLDLNARKGFPEAKDVYVGYHGLEWMSLRFGQFKVPASRQRLVSGRDTLFVERSPVSGDFVPGRDMGLALGLHTPLKHYNMWLGAFVGRGENQTKDDEEGFPLLSARLEAMPFATLSSGEGDVGQSQDFALLVGAFGTYSRDRAALANGTTGAALMTIDGDRLLYGADLSIKYKGFFAHAEFAGAYYQPTLGSDYFGAGIIAQASYFIAPIFLEPAVRFDELNPSDQAEDDRMRSLAFGLHVYPLHSHKLKLMLDYTHGLEGLDDELAMMVQLAYP